MSGIVLRLKTDLRQRLDVSPLLPETLAGLDAAQVVALPLQYGNRTVALGELFELEGFDAAPVLTLRNASGKLDYVASGLSAGEVRVEGHAGAYVGLRMRGGTVSVSGNAGIFCGAEMRGGRITVNGQAGDWLGAALPGNRKGMAGGTVLVRGSAGDRVGDHMRRGVILIEGDVGDYLGARMVAGTIAVKGRVGAHAGYAMKRGTLLLAHEPDCLPPTFNDCGLHTLGFLPLLLKSFPPLGSTVFECGAVPGRVRRYAGDLAVGGKGELLLIQ